ncbi:MAG: TIR domain-containing protein [Limisphaerales bacterium]
MANDYIYEAFLSYLRERPCGPWVKDHFLPYFSHQLGNALNREAKVFFDQAEIHAGQKWPQTLKQALVHSRCLVAVWSPKCQRSNQTDPPWVTSGHFKLTRPWRLFFSIFSSWVSSFF